MSSSNGNGKRTLTIRELAEYLNFSQGSIYRYLKKGWLPPRIERFGQKRFDFDQVMEWLKNGPPEGR